MLFELQCNPTTNEFVREAGVISMPIKKKPTNLDAAREPVAPVVAQPKAVFLDPLETIAAAHLRDAEKLLDARLDEGLTRKRAVERAFFERMVRLTPTMI